MRHTFPPLWSVPLLLIAALIGVVYLTLWFPLLALAPGVLAIVWMQRKADAYVRTRQAHI